MSPRLLGSVLYFLYYGAAGAILPFLTLFYKQVGMDTYRIGILAALLPLISLFAGPLWGGLADYFHLHKRLLPMMLLATILPAVLLTQVEIFPLLVTVIIILGMFHFPIIPLADHAVLNTLGTKQHQYGRLRLWGSIGFGVSALGTGALIERTDIRLIFVVYLTANFLGALVAFRLPAAAQFKVEHYWSSLRRLVINPRWLGFLASIFLFGISSSAINNYYVLYLNALGAREGLTGLAIAVATLGEIPIFLLAPLILRRYSPTPLLLLAFSAVIVRCLLYSVIADPNLAVLVQLLHGPTFSAMWAAGVSYVNQIAPEGLGASAQGLFGATLYGLSGVGGALVGSQLFERLGPMGMFRYVGLFAAAGLALFAWVTFVYSRRHILHPISKG